MGAQGKVQVQPHISVTPSEMSRKIYGDKLNDVVADAKTHTVPYKLWNWDNWNKPVKFYPQNYNGLAGGYHRATRNAVIHPSLFQHLVNSKVDSFAPDYKVMEDLRNHAAQLGNTTAAKNNQRRAWALLHGQLNDEGVAAEITDNTVKGFLRKAFFNRAGRVGRHETGHSMLDRFPSQEELDVRKSLFEVSRSMPTTQFAGVKPENVRKHMDYLSDPVEAVNRARDIKAFGYHTTGRIPRTPEDYEQAIKLYLDRKTTPSSGFWEPVEDVRFYNSNPQFRKLLLDIMPGVVSAPDTRKTKSASTGFLEGVKCIMDELQLGDVRPMFKKSALIMAGRVA